MRFMLVDRITKLESGASVEGHKCWSLADDIFRDHFPGTPIVPGVLLVESMAQMMGFLVERSYRDQVGGTKVPLPLLSIIHKAKFRRFVCPGDRVDMIGTLSSLDTVRAACRVRASVDGEPRADAEFSFVIHSEDLEDMTPELRMHRASYARFVLSGLAGDGPG